MKKLLKSIFHQFANLIVEIIFTILKLFTFFKRHIYYEFLNKVYFKIINHKTKIIHKDNDNNLTSLTFYTPNETNYSNAKTFSDSEPETLEWIDNFNSDDKFIDIGANVGLYSVYYLNKHKNGYAYLFEPSFVNLRILFKNLELNRAKNYVIFPNPLFQKTMIGKFSLSYESEGSAFSSFVIDKGFDGKPLDSITEFNTYGLSLDDISKNKLIDPSSSIYHVKIDVDGAECEVLKGAYNFLKHPNIKTVLIELYLYENYNNILKMFEEMDFIQDKIFLEKTKLMQIDNVKKGIIYKELEPTVLNHLFIKKIK